MSIARVERWLAENPRRAPAEYACLLARDRFWQEPRTRLIVRHPDFGPGYATVEELLGLDPLLGQPLVLVLSRIPREARRDFADWFYDRRRSLLRAAPRDPRRRLQLAAGTALLVFDLADEGGQFGERVHDLLAGAAQGDDLSATPEPALEELYKAVARARLDADHEDPSDPQGAAALAVAEVLDPSSEQVALDEVVARAAWATVESRERSRVLAFLLELDGLLATARETVAGL